MSAVIFYQHYKPHVVDVSINNHHTEVDTQFMIPQWDVKITDCPDPLWLTDQKDDSHNSTDIYLNRPLGAKALYFPLLWLSAGRGDVQWEMERNEMAKVVITVHSAIEKQ